MNVVFIASEANPLAKTGGLADVAGALPQALLNQNHTLTVIMPYYRPQVDAASLSIKRTSQAIAIWADGIKRVCPIHETKINGVRFLLVEQDDLYQRDGLYGPSGGAYHDNLLRFVLFNRVALELAAQFDLDVDIMHCHDWQTGMVPLLLQSQYRHLPRLFFTKTVFTIHNLAYQGIFPPEWMARLGIPSNHFHADGIEFYGQLNCMKAGIMMSDAITTVSETYAQEILTPEYGCGLNGYLSQFKSKLSGIVNGIDTNDWNPEKDTLIPAKFHSRNITGKAICKQALQMSCGLSPSTKTPLLTLISRLAEQKGIDLILANIERWMQCGYQLAVLGSGDIEMEQAFASLAQTHPKQMYFSNGFNEPLAHKIYAGGDMFLMPSRFEPCGLGQLIAMRYGNVPIVRATGGLCDTVTNYMTSKADATGFHFSDLTPQSLSNAVDQATKLYQQPRIWARIRKNALNKDSSWDQSAKLYSQLYSELERK